MANLQTWEEVQVVLASPLPSVEVAHSTESTPPSTNLIDLTKEESSTIGSKRTTSDPMDVDKESKREKHEQNPELQLLMYIRRNSMEASTETKSSGPSFSIEFFNTTILG